MERLDRAISSFRSMEAEAREAGLVQSLNPLSKLLVTVFYLVILLPLSMLGSLLERRVRYAEFGP